MNHGISFKFMEIKIWIVNKKKSIKMQTYSGEKIKGGRIARKIRCELHLTGLLLKCPRAQMKEVMLWNQYLPQTPPAALT